MVKLLVVGILSLGLVGCLEVEEGDTIDLSGTWRVVYSLSSCPDIEASYYQDFIDSNDDDFLNTVQRYSGNLIQDLGNGNCPTVAVSHNPIDITSLGVSEYPTKDEFQEDLRGFVANLYNLNLSQVSITLVEFDQDEIRYTATAAEGNVVSFSETARWFK